MVNSILSEEYQLGIEYEVVRELVNFEIAYHTAQCYKVGEGTTLGNMHEDARGALVRLRKTMRVDDANSIAAVKIAVEVMKADKAHIEALESLANSKTEKQQKETAVGSCPEAAVA